MTIHDDGRRDKWLAYALGELPEAERAGVEAELAAHPEELKRLQQTIATVRAWAGEVALGEASDVSAIVSEARHGGSRRDTNAGQSVRAGVPRWVWGVAAAALLLIALGQVQFTVTVGGTTFTWGSARQVSDATPDAALASKVEELAAKHAAAEQQLAFMRNQYEALVHSVKGTTEALAYSQQVESATRYRDVQQLLQLAGGR
jgi:anti-sigma factor RsiW